VPPVKLTTSVDPLDVAAAYQPISGGTLLVDGTQAATEGGTVFGTGYTEWQTVVGSFGNTFQPLNFAGIAAFVGNGLEIGNGTLVRTGPGLPIGFPFTFNGDVFDRIGISSHGWISFGKSADGASAVQVYTSTAPSNNNLPLFNSTTPGTVNGTYKRNRVVAYGIQGGGHASGSGLIPLVFQSGYSAYPGSTLRMETTGTAPNRVCVVQWENYVVSVNSLDPQFFRVMNFQIRLYETTNNVEVRYGNCQRGPGVTGFSQVGLGGQTGGNGPGGDFNAWIKDQSIGGGWPTAWNGDFTAREALPVPSGLVHSLPSSVFPSSNASTTQISSGSQTTPDMLSFVWSPPTCPQQASAVSISNVGLASADVNWSVGTGTSFDYAVSTTNNVAAATITGTVSGNSVNLTSLSNGTNYYVFVRTNCGGGDVSAWSSPQTFKTFFSLDCGTTWTAGSSSDPNLNNSTGAAFKNTYVICPSVPGEKATIDFSTWAAPMFTNQQFNALLIYDGDSQASPIIAGPGTGASCTGNCNPNVIASFSVPAGGWMNDTPPPVITSTAANGCLTVVWYSLGYAGWSNGGGWAMDITCAPPPTCFPPLDRAVSATTPDGATFTWNSGASPAVDYIVVAVGGTPASTVLASGTSSTGTGSVSGLDPNTQYTAFFRGSCDGGSDLSAWSDPGLNFRTRVGCGGTLFMGDYPASALVPLDSIVVICPDNLGDVVTVDFTDFYPGDRDLHMLVYDGPNTSAPFLNSGQTTSAPGFPTGGYRTAGIANLPSEFISTHSSGCITFRFVATQPRFNFPAVNILANVTCAPAPACAAPNGVSLSNIGGTTATVNWTGSGSEYVIEYGPQGFVPGTAATAGTNGTIVTPAVSGESIGGLSPTSVYDIYVRQVCAGPTYSTNSFRVRFTTSMDCSTAQVLSCGELTTATFGFDPGNAVYQNTAYSAASCLGENTTTGVEKLYRFTAPTSGAYQLNIATNTFATTGKGVFLIAPVSSGCGAAAFTCLSTGYSATGGQFGQGPGLPSALNTTLAAGDYYIIADASNNYEGALGFQMFCPGIPACVTAPNYPPNNTTLAVTTAGTTFTWPAAFGATSYDVYFQGNFVANTPTNSIVGGSGYSTANLAALFGIGSTITWRVVPKNADGTATCNTDWTFRVGGNGAANAIPLTSGVTVNGNTRASNGYTNIRTAPQWGMDAWYTFTASDCADSLRINLCPTGGWDSNNSVNIPNGYAFFTLLEGATVLAAVEDNNAGATSGCVNGAPSTFKVEPGISYTIIMDGYAWQYDFDLTVTEVGLTADFDGDGIPDCEDTCPETVGQVGDPCSVNILYSSGVINGDCECEGTLAPCTNDLTLEVSTDINGQDITWEVLHNGGIILSGGGVDFPNDGVVTEFFCLPNACYNLRVYDAGGDGIAGGGYTLRTSGVNGDRIIDNAGNFTSGSVSAIGSGASQFCFPLGTTKPQFQHQDKLDFVSGNYFIAEEDAAVSAVWIPNGANNVQSTTTGYEFWIFDPNGTYSYRRFRNHATSDGFGNVGATRTCHMKINNWWASQAAPANVLLNVRIRTRVNGVNGPFGPAYRFKIDPARAACPLTQLNDFPGTQFESCNQTRTWGSGIVHAIPVPGANSYQWRFRTVGEPLAPIITRTSNTYFLQLNWPTNPLVPGKTYTVDVRARKGTTWCTDAVAPALVDPWGDICSLTINGGNVQGGGDQLGLVDGGTGLAMYPNPNRGDQLWLNIDMIEEGVEMITVDFFDLAGHRAVSRMIPTQGDRLQTVLDLKGELAAGVYIVHIAAGQKVYTERLVITQ
jgi:hypothetical protein